MLGRVIFCVVIAAAVLAVVLLATVSPLPRRSTGRGRAHPSPRVLTVYLHPEQQEQGARGAAAAAASALVFRHRMTAGPESTARALGAASGFVLPGGGGGAAMSAFDTVHLAFDAAGHSGGLCVEAARSKVATAAPGHRRRRRRDSDGEEELLLRVVGGTGAFAFAGGHGALRAMATATALRLRLELSVAPDET